MSDHKFNDLDRAILRALDGCHMTVGQLHAATGSTLPDAVCCAFAVGDLRNAGYIDTRDLGDTLLHSLTEQGREWVAAHREPAPPAAATAQQAREVAVLRAAVEDACKTFASEGDCPWDGSHKLAEQIDCGILRIANCPVSCREKRDEREYKDCWRMYLLAAGERAVAESETREATADGC